MNNKKIPTLLFVTLFLMFGHSFVLQAIPKNAPERTRGDGPFQKLILRGGILINGEGAPPRGPVDIVIEKNRIVQIVDVGNPGVPIVKPRPKAETGDKEIDISGHYVLPGFIDMHAHIGGDSQQTTAEYSLKLWLAHGITTVREPGSFNGADFVMHHVKASKKNTIASPG